MANNCVARSKRLPDVLLQSIHCVHKWHGVANPQSVNHSHLIATGHPVPVQGGASSVISQSPYFWERCVTSQKRL